VAPTATSGTGQMAALLALAGGAVAVVSAWLPWITGLGADMKPIDVTDTSTLACGYYLIIGGGIAAACGLLLLMRFGRGTGLPMLFGLGAVIGGGLVIAAEYVAYGKVNDTINAMSGYGVEAGIAVGYGLYVGIGAGIAGALGGLLGLVNRS